MSETSESVNSASDGAPERIEIQKKNPPLTTNFIFETHALKNQEEVESKEKFLRQEFTSMLKRDVPNIFLIEGSLENEEQRETIHEGFNKFKSLRKALVYQTLKSGEGLTEEKLDKLVIEVEDTLLGDITDPASTYKWVQAKIIDEFIEMGFDVDIMFEKGIPHTQKREVTSAAELKAVIENRRADSNKRNQILAEQLEHLYVENNSQRRTANLIAMFGTFHYKLPELLNDELRKDSYVYIQPTSINPDLQTKINHALIEGIPVSESMYETAFEGAPEPSLFQKIYSIFKRKS